MARETTATPPTKPETGAGSKFAEVARQRRAADYLAAAQIYLRDNVLLREPLKAEHLKKRLLGHWGTCPGINLIYAHLNRLIRESGCQMLLVTGPGHGAPANIANLFLEGSLGGFYPELKPTGNGLRETVVRFSKPGGFPSHLYPGLPGTILEGGELGYCLSTAYGAAMDNPELIVPCIVGDGEAETGPLAASWKSHYFLDPAESGAVLPILHLNHYKIASRTVFGSMPLEQVRAHFESLGHEVKIVTSGPGHDKQMAEAMDWSLRQIREIQRLAREEGRRQQLRWPMIVLNSPKGWSTVDEWEGEPIEGTYRAHQVPLKEVQENEEQLRLLEAWMRHYKPEELFDEEGAPKAETIANCPKGDLRMGCNPHALGGKVRRDLKLPDLKNTALRLSDGISSEKGTARGDKESNTKAVGKWLADLVERNPDSFRVFCPDELESNKVDGILKATQRNFQLPVGEEDENVGPDGGRVIEVLSEHLCQGWLQGYILTGRYGLFPSYEAFLNIVTSMMDQYAKFIQRSKDVDWRPPVPSLNYLETSTLWRQEHNGFSHQNPSFINALLDQGAEFARVYLPADVNTALLAMERCMASVGLINLVIANKNPLPQWLDLDAARKHFEDGIGIWDWAGTAGEDNPEIVLAGIGDVPTTEVIAAARILGRELPDLRTRVVNVVDLLVLQSESQHPHGLATDGFERFFPKGAPAILNFHGYPSVLKQLLYEREDSSRFILNGYQEEGSTTTPFAMALMNGISRYDLVIQAARAAGASDAAPANETEHLITSMKRKIEYTWNHIYAEGTDTDEINNWTWDFGA